MDLSETIGIKINKNKKEQQFIKKKSKLLGKNLHLINNLDDDIIQNNTPQRNQHNIGTSFLEFGNNQTKNKFPLRFCNENSEESSPNLSLTQTNKINSNNNSKEKKKSDRYYQVRSI